MSREQDRLSAFITGLLAGGVIGSALALLYAPSSGKKLRRNISRRADDFIDDVEDYYESSREKAEEIINEGKKRANSIIDNARKIASN